MLLYNRGYYASIDGVNPSGVVLCTSTINFTQLSSRNEAYNLDMVLYDPQYYLCSIDKAACGSTFSKIISYPWISVSPPKTSPVIKKLQKANTQHSNSSRNILIPKTDQEVTDCIDLCFKAQKKIGVTHLIVPTPLAVAREDQFSEQLRWLNLAQSLKSDYIEPFLATIALSDETLLNCSFEENLMLQTILDHAAVMQHIDGYYIVIERDAVTSQITEMNVARALLELSYNLGYHQEKEVIINFADVFGLVCLAVGATAFGSGYRVKERRLCLDDFIERTGGTALPRYYSSSLIGDFYSERDLERIVELKLFRYISNDIITSQSQSLINALENKVKVKTIEPWKETRSNVATAAKHRVNCISEQANLVMKCQTIEERLNLVFTWIQDAEAHMGYLKSRLKDNPLREDGRHLSVWRNAIESFMESNEIIL